MALPNIYEQNKDAHEEVIDPADFEHLAEYASNPIYKGFAKKKEQRSFFGLSIDVIPDSKQMEMPIKPSGKRRGGTVQSTYKKIVGYNLSDLKVYRALFATSQSVLANWDTWHHLGLLTIVSVVSYGVVEGTGSAASFPIDMLESELIVRIRVLLAFVITAFVGIMIGRYNHLRHGTIGSLWGGLENICLLAHSMYIDRVDFTTHPAALVRDRVLRYCRLCFLLLFSAAQNNEDYTKLFDLGIITTLEEAYLKKCTIGTRPLVVLGWVKSCMTKMIHASKTAKKSPDIPDRTVQDLSCDLDFLQENVAQARGGIGATLGIVGCNSPYTYSHLVYWVVQVYLTVLAISTGIFFSAAWDRRYNGDNQYVYPTRLERWWPDDPHQWFAGVCIIRIVGNVFLALFLEGLLKICEACQNPLSTLETSFPEFAYDSFLNNNVRALFYGLDTIDNFINSEEQEFLSGKHAEKKEESKSANVSKLRHQYGD